MPKYYANASPAEVDAAMAALGVTTHRNAGTINHSIVGDKARDILGNQIDRTYESDPDAHAEQLAHLAEVTAQPEPDKADVRTMTNAEWANYAHRNGIPIGSRMQTNALAYPDERPHAATPAQQQAPTDDDAA